MIISKIPSTFVLLTIFALLPCFLSHTLKPDYLPETTTAQHPTQPDALAKSIESGILSFKAKSEKHLRSRRLDEDTQNDPVSKDDTPADNIVQLIEAVPHNSTLSSDGSAFFRFTITEQNSQAQSLQIVITNTTIEDLVICVRNDDILPEEGKCHWSSTTGPEVSISFTDARFDPKKTYTIGVFPGSDTEDDIGQIPFKIGWYQMPGFQTIRFGSEVSGNVRKETPQYFQFSITVTESSRVLLQLAQDTNLDQIQVELFNSTVDAISTRSPYASSAFMNHISSLEINSTSLKELCQESVGSDNPCTLFLAVTAKESSVMTFRLRLETRYIYMRLRKSIQNSLLQMSRGIIPTRVTFTPSQPNDTFLTINTFSTEVNVYVSVIDTSKYATATAWPWPTEESHNYTATKAVAVTIKIPASAFEGCWSASSPLRCGIIATVIPTEAPEENRPFFLNALATQEAQPITAGQDVEGTLDVNQFKYFSLEITRVQATIIISISSEDREVSFVVSKGQNHRPVEQNAQFVSGRRLGATMRQISNTDTRDNSMRGTWIIGVYNKNGNASAADFTLNVAYQDQKTITLDSGVPKHVFIPDQHIQYFTYFAIDPSEILFKFILVEGSGGYYISTVSQNSAVMRGLPGEENNYWNGVLNQLRTDRTIRNDTEPNFCQFCHYFIAVKAASDMELILTVNANNQDTKLEGDTTIKDSVDDDVRNKYLLTLRKEQQQNLNVLANSGKLVIFIGKQGVNETNYIWRCEPKKDVYTSFEIDSEVSEKTSSVSIPGCNNDETVTLDGSTLYVLVLANTSTVYSMGINSFGRSTLVPFNQKLAGFLNPNQSNTYINSFSDPLNNSTFIRIVTRRSLFTNAFDEKYTPPQLTVTPASNKDSTTKTTILNPIRTFFMQAPAGDILYTSIFQFPQFNGTNYSVELLNNYTTTPINYTIIIDPKSPTELPVNTPFISTTLVGTSDIYMVSIEQPGILLLEAHECIGDVSVSYASSFVQGRATDPSVVQDLDTSSHIAFVSDRLEYGQVVYINVTSLEGAIIDDKIAANESVYKIKATFYGKDTMDLLLPYSNFSAGDGGNLMTTLNGDSHLRVHFGPVVFRGTPPPQVGTPNANEGLSLNTSYHVFIARDRLVGEFMSRCDVMPEPKGIFKNRDMDLSTLAFNQSQVGRDAESDPETINKYIETGHILSPGLSFVSLRANLMGINSTGNVLWQYPVLYDSIDAVRTIEVSSGGHTLLIVILVLAAIIIVALGCWYRSRMVAKKRALLADTEGSSTGGSYMPLIGDRKDDEF